MLSPTDDAPFTWAHGFCWFDLECSGFAKTDTIIEIGAVTDDGGTFDVKVALPDGVTVHPEAAKVNGYTPEEWAGAMSLEAALALFEAFAEGRCMVGHNIWRYDFQFLIRAMGEARARKLLRCSIDTLEMYKAANGPSAKKNLHACCEHYGIEPEGVHRALGGAQRVQKLFGAIVGGRRPAAPVCSVQRVASEF
jgi:DNA polymerase III alpha subunit (gram-positive type)